MAGAPVRQRSDRLQQVLPTPTRSRRRWVIPSIRPAREITGSITLLPNGDSRATAMPPHWTAWAPTPLMRVVYEQGMSAMWRCGTSPATARGDLSPAPTPVVRFASDADAARMFATFVTRWQSSQTTSP